MIGDNPSPWRKQLVSDILGSEGAGTHFGAVDLTPAGQALGVQESLQHGDPQQAALWAMPGAPGAKSLAGAAERKIASSAADVEKLLADYHAKQAHVPLDVSNFQKTGPQEGSNPGGTYADPVSGAEWYVKSPKTTDHANNEKLANELYKEAGVPVPDVRLTKDGLVASKIVEGKRLDKMGLDDYSDVKGLQEHFPVDAWLGNYDAIGTGKDNIIVDADGVAHRIDAGGALRYRAQGKPKTNWGPEVPELKSMKDPDINPDSHDVFHNSDHDLETQSAQRIAEIPGYRIRALVDQYGPPTMAAKEELTATLLKRQKKIADHYGVGGEGPTGGGEHPPGTEPEWHPPQDDDIPEWNPTEGPRPGTEEALGKDPKADAAFLMEHNMGDAKSIAQDMHNMAFKDPLHVDEVYKHLPEDIQPDVNAHLSQIIENNGDPWAEKTAIKDDPRNDPKIIADALKPLDWLKYKPPGAKSARLHNKTPEEVKQLGFNPEVELYKGGDYHDYPEEIPDPKNKSSVPGGPLPERANFLADQPYISQGYGTLGEPYIASATKALEVDWRQLDSSGAYSNWIMRKIIEEGHRQGADLVVIHGLSDVGSTNHTQYAFLSVKGLRGTRAKFDPNKLHLARPLAGLAGGGLFGYGMLDSNKEEGKMKRGGVTKKAGGGELFNPESMLIRGASYGLRREGMINSSVPGRTDKLPMNVAAGSYVLPADIPSALGQGNSAAGGQILSKMFSSGPYGLPTMHAGSGRGPGAGHLPRPPAAPKMHFAEGGEAGDDHIPIIAAGGEFIIHPDVVKDLGHGDITKGHRVLDQFVLHTRKEHIKTLKKLPGPKR